MDDIELPKKYLFKGELKSRVVSNGVLEQAKMTQVYTFPYEDGLATVAFVIDDAGIARMAFGGENGLQARGIEVIGAYRAFCLMEGLSRIDGETCVAVLQAPYMGLMEDEEDVSDIQKILFKQFEPETLARILKGLPDDLVDTLRRVRDDLDMPLYTGFITDEVEAERLQYSGDLEAFKVEHPRDRTKRIQYYTEIRERARPCLKDYLDREGHKDHGDCVCLKKLEDKAVVAAVKKLTDEWPMQIGMAILASHAQQQGDIWAVFIPMHEYSVSRIFAGTRCKPLCKKVASFIAEKFQMTAPPNAIAKQLRSLMLLWDAANPDETKS